MGEQHYGRAPCGCYREHPEPFVEGFVPSSSVCRQHGALFMDGVLAAPWHAASAIEQFVRACACDCLRCMGYRNIRGEWYSPKELMGVIRDVYSYGAVARTWFSDAIVGASAAWAIEQGLRAIAGWSYSERRAFNEALAYWLDHPGPVYGAKLTEVVGLTGAALRRRGYQPVGTLAGAPVRTDPYLRGDQRVQLADGGYIISREAWAEASKKAVYPVSARTACYFCGRAVADGVCTVCGERQPE